MPWPNNWDAMRSGRDCPICAEGRPEESDGRVRVYAGHVVDGYLNRDDAARGYVIAFYRGGHATEPTELSPDHSIQFWQELLTIQGAIERQFRPMKVNLLILGNAVPHLHAHIVPRYRDDPDGGAPPRFMMGSSDWHPLDDATYLADVQGLKSALSSSDSAKPDMPDLDRIRAATRAWLTHIGDLGHSPVIVPFGDPEGAEVRARYELAKVLRSELFEPIRHGPIYLWSGEAPLEGKVQHWGGSDIWRCDDHPDWRGEELGSWERYWRDDSTYKLQGERPEKEVRREWEDESLEAHAALHGVEIG